MILSLKNSIFLIGLAVFQILLLFSFATDLEVITISGFVLFLLIYSVVFKLKFNFITIFHKIFIFLLIWLTISSIFSHNIPLSLENMVFFTSSFLVFTFFFELFKSEKMKIDFIFLDILIVGFVLSIFFIFFFVYSGVLPTLNLISVYYGHSHFAAVLLIITPIAWWFYYSPYSKRFRFKIFLLIYFHILMFFTFGRFALLLSVASLPLLINNLKKKISIKYAGIFAAVLFAGLLIFIMSFTNIFCSSHELKLQSCKSLSTEARPEYFRRALTAVKEFPIAGYGPGTFSLISAKYGKLGLQSSSYAHSFIFQVLAESGIVAVSIIIVMIIIVLRESIKKMKIKENSLLYFLSIAFILSFLNSLADFDWNTFFVFQLSIILAAGILSGGKSAILKSNEAIEQRLLFIFLSVLIILLGLLNVLTNLMIADGQANLVVKTFPYFYMQNADLQKNKNLTKKNLEKLYSIYKYDPDFLAVYADRSTSENRKLEVYSQLDEIANWNLINTNYLKLLKSRNEYEIIGKRVYKAFQEINSMKQEESNITYQLRKDLASYLKLAADFELQRGNIDLAVLYYQEILKVQKWAFHVQRPFFLDSDISLKYLGLFLVKLNERRDLFGKNRDEVQSWLIAKIFENVVSSDTEKVDLALFANYFTQEELVIKVGE